MADAEKVTLTVPDKFEPGSTEGTHTVTVADTKFTLSQF